MNKKTANSSATLPPCPKCGHHPSWHYTAARQQNPRTKVWEWVEECGSLDCHCVTRTPSEFRPVTDLERQVMGLV